MNEREGVSEKMHIPSWIKRAVLLGLSFFMAVWLVKPVGVSTQFSVLSGIIHTSIEPTALEENAYYQKDGGKIAEEIENPINYNFVFVLAIPVGGFIGYTLDKKRLQKNQKQQSCQIKKSFWKTYGLPFMGGVLLLFGARMAGGCTSGHMMSGMMQGSVSGYVFALCVFITAIPTALIVTKLRLRKGEM